LRIDTGRSLANHRADFSPDLDNWTVITPSSFAHEIEALEFVRSGLSPSCHAFANFTFIGLDGSLNEVDLLIIGPWGFFFCEIKSRPGVIKGDAQTWRWEEGGRVFSDDNPLLLAQRKCQKLKSLLLKQKALRDQSLPFLEPVIFLSHPSNLIALPPDARMRVFLRDTANQPGIRAALNRREGAGLKVLDHPPINRPIMGAVLRAMHEIGLKPKTGARRAGDYELGQLLYESPAHTVQDWEASHVVAKSGPRLARLYLVSSAATKEDRERLTKAARRDFELIEPLDHPGLLRVETMVSTERGPAVIYRYPKDARRLDHFLADKGDTLSVEDRLSLLRQIAEAIAYAHDHRVIHRGLTPQSILVSPADGHGFRAHVYNWQLGSGPLTHTATVGTRSLHATDLLEDVSTAYLAPESIAGVNLDAKELDSFSLGALAYRLFTDQPPAHSSIELAGILREGPGYLDVALVKDGLPESLRDLVIFTTNRDATMRFSARQFVQQLNEVEDELTRPEPQHVLDPRTARSGDQLEQGLQVVRRLGSGSVSVVFLVRAPNSKEPLVLKLAVQPEYNERLKAEHAALKKLVHPGIVQAHELFESGGITGFLMDCAVEVPKEWLAEVEADAVASSEPSTKRERFAEAETLSVHLRRLGRLEIDLLQTFGADLLTALEYVHDCGLAHRDVKPDNIGLRIPRSRDRVRLILFDFSLANASLDEIRVGTPPYLDPFLPLRKIKRWDSHAERFSAAMTLYEMAAGALPKWGDGHSAPHLLDDEVTIQPELFISDLREKLASFFARALRRDYRKRFDTWEQMRTAWAEVFQNVDEPVVPLRPPTEDAPTPAAVDLVGHATKDTQLIQLGLSTRAFNALDRLRLVTVDELLQYPLARIYRMPGVGHKTRLELADLVRALREHFSQSGADLSSDTAASLELVMEGHGTAKDVDPNAQSIDLIARQIVVRRSGNKGSQEHTALERFIGVNCPENSPPAEWISQSDVAPALGITRARVGQVVEKARERWSKLPALTSVRHEIERILRSQGGVMTHRELISAVLSTRGSAFDEPERTRLASLVVRAAVETEKGLEEPRFLEVRRAGHIFVALDRPLADWALAIAKASDDLLLEGGETLPSRARTIETLQSVSRPALIGREECPPPDPTRLVSLATALATVARANARLELYPVGLPPERSLLLCRSTFFQTGPLSVEDLAKRVASRFPEAKPLPADRGALEALIKAADVPLRWSLAARGGSGAFVNAVEFDSMFTMTEKSSHRLRTFTHSVPMPVMPEQVATALLLEEKLQSCATRGSFLVLSVPPDRLARAETELLARFPVEKVDGDALFLQHLHALAAQYEIAWDQILSSDAAPEDSFDGQQLRRLVEMIKPQLRDAIVSARQTRLLVNPGLFARYGLMGMLATLRDDTGRTGGPHGVWVLIPAVVDSALPKLNGQPVPIIADHQHITLPDAWLNNVHRSTLASAKK
jgi:serine/threonine protein kinase